MEHLVLQLLVTARGRCVIAVVAIAIGVVFCAVVWPDVRGDWKLKRSSAIVQAQVVDTRVSRTEHGRTCYDVRYRFRTSERGPWYTRAEPGTGRAALWTELPKDEWDRARATGRLAVAYLPEDARINRPASVRSSSARDSIAGLVIGLILAAGGSVMLVVSVGQWLVPNVPAGPTMRPAPRPL